MFRSYRKYKLYEMLEQSHNTQAIIMDRLERLQAEILILRDERTLGNVYVAQTGTRQKWEIG